MSCCEQTNLARGTAAARRPEAPAATEDRPAIDAKVKLLIAAGAAVAANCEPCLNKIHAQLRQAGVSVPDICRAIQIGQFVKDQSAAHMKKVAEALTGEKVTDTPASARCPADADSTVPTPASGTSACGAA